MRDGPTAAFAGELEALGAALRDVEEAEFARPTRCPPWDVKALLAHLRGAFGRLPAMLAAPAPASAGVDAAGYFRAASWQKPEAHTTRQHDGRAQAERFPSGAELVAAVAADGRRMLEQAAAEPGGRLVTTRWGDDMTLEDFLATRVLEVAVHGLDLADALGRPPWLTAEAAAVTGPCSASLLPHGSGGTR